MKVACRQPIDGVICVLIEHGDKHGETARLLSRQDGAGEQETDELFVQSKLAFIENAGTALDV